MTRNQRISSKRGKGFSRFWRKAIYVLLGLLLLTWPGLERAWASEQTVRVGYEITGNYLYKADNGEYRGYDVEYLYAIAKYTDWNYEFVPFADWAGAVSALQQGKIDLLPTVLKSPEREATMLFPARSMGNAYVALIVRNDGQQYKYDDLAELQGLRIGTRHNTVDTKDFYAWAGEQGLQYTAVEFNTKKELLEALEAGTIDAAALSYTGDIRHYRAVAEFAPHGMYFAIAPSRKDLLRQMDWAMGQLSIMNPAFFANISRKYLEVDANPVPVFSAEELAFID